MAGTVPTSFSENLNRALFQPYKKFSPAVSALTDAFREYQREGLSG